VKSGLNLWDTALVYGMGSSEKVVGEFIKDYPREDLFISPSLPLSLQKNRRILWKKCFIKALKT
jgi:aryl-alcohol dehydrogenase-like predicted oxidoreductase